MSDDNPTTLGKRVVLVVKSPLLTLRMAGKPLFGQLAKPGIYLGLAGGGFAVYRYGMRWKPVLLFALAGNAVGWAFADVIGAMAQKKVTAAQIGVMLASISEIPIKNLISGKPPDE